MKKIVATSDLHGYLPKIPPCDLLLLAGDLCIGGSPLIQAKWLDEEFRVWLEGLEVKEVVGIAGNHDYIFEKHEHLVPKGLKWHYLQDEEIEVEGIKIYGTPWQPPFWGAFNLPEKELKLQFRHIPEGLDILLTHSPPFGILDEIPNFLHESEELSETAIHAGSLALRDKILEVRPKFAIFGHIHHSFGRMEKNGITYANVSLRDEEMEVTHTPLSFTL